MTKEYDIIIVGGGMVGASMALAASHLGLNIALVESSPIQSDEQPSFDERTVALTYSSYLIFDSIGAWPKMQPYACPIKSIEVTNDQHYGFTHLDNKDANTDTLGYVIATRDVGRALYNQLLDCSNVDIICPADAISSSESTSGVHVNIIKKDESVPTKLSGKCMILADGGRSKLTQELNIKKKSKLYDQKALVTIISCEDKHNHKAFEHFMQNGPLALLPFRQNDYALVWTDNADKVDFLKKCPDEDFLKEINQLFHGRISKVNKLGKRSVYPLSNAQTSSTTTNRTVIIGNAAHIVHPVAGQGFNLGLRDVAELCDVFKQYIEDPGSPAALTLYEKSRKSDTRKVSLFTDNLLKVFNSNKVPLVVGRNLGLTMLNSMPRLKTKILHRTMGIHKQKSSLLKRLK